MLVERLGDLAMGMAMGMEMFWKFGKQSSIPQKWQFPCKLEGNISQQQADEIDDLVCLEYAATNFVGYVHREAKYETKHQ